MIVDATAAIDSFSTRDMSETRYIPRQFNIADDPSLFNPCTLALRFIEQIKWVYNYCNVGHTLIDKHNSTQRVFHWI